MPLEALILDVDGTLAETEEAHRRAFNQAFADAQLDWHWDRRLYGALLEVAGGKERLRHFAQNHAPDALTETDIAALHAAKTAIYGRMVRSGEVPLRDGVERLLREARAAGVTLAIATTTSRANIDALLEATLGPGALAWFDAIAAGDMVKAKKPAPDVYRLALRKLALDGRNCLAIEDSRIGLLAAVGAGIPTIITVSGYTAGQRFDEALAVLTGLGTPSRPFRALGGLADGAGIADLALLRAWHDAGANGP